MRPFMQALLASFALVSAAQLATSCADMAMSAEAAPPIAGDYYLLSTEAGTPLPLSATLRDGTDEDAFLFSYELDGTAYVERWGITDQGPLY